MRRWTAVLVAVVALAAVPACDPPAKPIAIRVDGTRFVDGAGATLVLRGVNRSGLEYRCVSLSDPGFVTDDNSLDGRTLAYTESVVAAIRSWPGVNAVRIPLNESCWLGINGAGVSPAAAAADPTLRVGDFAGARYREFVTVLVLRLVAAGIFPILDLHWSAAGATLARGQDVLPNRDHSIDFWRSVASTFAPWIDARGRRHPGVPQVLFDLHNEPQVYCSSGVHVVRGVSYDCSSGYEAQRAVSWAWYRDGTAQWAGVRELVAAIRSTGSSSPILVAGLGWANALDWWPTTFANPADPIDPLGQLAASFHTYVESGANVWTGDAQHPAPEYVNATVGPTGDKVPVVVTEFGETGCQQEVTGIAADTIDWADSHGYSWTAWAWDRGQGCNRLNTSNDTGAPSPYGAVVKSKLG